MGTNILLASLSKARPGLLKGNRDSLRRIEQSDKPLEEFGKIRKQTMQETGRDSMILRYKPGSGQCFYGVQTNEASLKAVLFEQMSIDLLILIVTDEILKTQAGSFLSTENLENRDIPLAKAIQLLEHDNPDADLSDNTLAYYLQEIHALCDDDNSYKVGAVHLVRHSSGSQVSSLTNLSTAIAIVLLKANENKGPFQLYIDTNGGQRDFMTILMGTLRMIRTYGITPRKALYAAYVAGQDTEKQPIRVLDIRKNYEIFDVVSGLDEYILYGRVDKLINYFQDAGANTIFKALRSFSNSLVLCDMETLIPNLKKLIMALQSHTEKEEDRLFEYVISKVREDFSAGLMQADMDSPYLGTGLLSLIRWCAQKGYIQQALTLFSEKIPMLIVERKCIVPNMPIGGDIQNQMSLPSHDGKTPKDYNEECVAYVRYYLCGTKNHDKNRTFIKLWNQYEGGGREENKLNKQVLGMAVHKEYFQLTKKKEIIIKILDIYRNMNYLRNRVCHSNKSAQPPWDTFKQNPVGYIQNVLIEFQNFFSK